MSESLSAAAADLPLEALRARLKSLDVQAFIITSEDPHNSEYVCAADMRRSFISNFTGSAGTALVLQDQALLWTDGRYFLQASQELSHQWTLMKSGEPNVPDLNSWIANNMKSGAKVGVDPWLISAGAAKALEQMLSPKGIVLVALAENPIDLIWQSVGTRPLYSINAVEPLPIERSGVLHTSKLEKIVSTMKEAKAGALLVTMLDEICWLLNIRGSDIDFNPVAIAYVVVTDEQVFLFIGIKHFL